MISLLTPTRGRPNNMLRLCKSVEETACDPNNIEIVFYIDTDDTKSEEQFQEIWNAGFAVNVYAWIGERTLMSNMWNECYKIGEGPIYMYCGDDIIFRTKKWDEEILKVFAEYKDKIVLVHGRDGFEESPNTSNWNEQLATHGFIHRNWVETVGYFFPPYFSCNVNDSWLSDVAIALNRKVYLPGVFTEHMHPSVCGKDGRPKASVDVTHQERLARGKKDNVQQIWKDSQHLVVRDIKLLADFIKERAQSL